MDKIGWVGQAEQTPPGTVFDLARGQSGIDPVDQGADVLSHHLVGDEHDDRDRRQDERIFCHRLALAEALAEFARLHVHPCHFLHLRSSLFALSGCTWVRGWTAPPSMIS